MKVKIISKEQNPLLKRKEVIFRIEHEKNGGTPTRVEIRKELATLLKTDLELVYVKQMETKTGTMVAVGEANAYESIEQANLIEPKHIIARNASPEKPEKAEEPQAPEEPTEKERQFLDCLFGDKEALIFGEQLFQEYWNQYKPGVAGRWMILYYIFENEGYFRRFFIRRIKAKFGEIPRAKAGREGTKKEGKVIYLQKER